MDEFTGILSAATGAIATEYINLPLHGGDSVLRERVYCYELYHQMRCLWPRDTVYRLNGEVDKRNHPYFHDQTSPKPDLLVHQPGTGANYAVIEVKSGLANSAGVLKDFGTLTRFLREFGYERAIYLLYGVGVENTLILIDKIALDIPGHERVEIWTHEHAGTQARRMR